MKTEVTSDIEFKDGVNHQLCNEFKRIFPKTDLNVNLFDFQILKKREGLYNLVLEIDIEYREQGLHRFTYTRTTEDLVKIDKLKSDANTGLETRRCIIKMIGNDTFIEELDDFLENLKLHER